jgi:enolase-phosphatase E1
MTYAPKAVLLDIEGTISSLPHVVNTFYPFTAKHLAAFLERRGGDPEVAAAIEDTRALAGPGIAPQEALLQWIAEDRKAPPLKFLQGLVWEDGYRSGELVGHIYPDALEVLRRWHDRGLPLHIFSSGSVQCQAQFYEHSPHGDLRHLFSGHFDTGVGAKIEAESYRRIAEALGLRTSDLLFFTDNPRELEAASSAGVPVIQVLREDTRADGRFPAISSFHDVELSDPQ